MKKAIRLLVTSEAWRRSSTPVGKAGELDPGNLLLSHFRVRRLEAEAIRDSLLAVTGELQEGMYGPPITGGAPRRSVYMRIQRNDLDPFLAAFDAPVPASTVGRRDVTNVPAQSLTMLNSDFVIGLAERWAGRVSGASVEAKAGRMIEAALGREPSDAELQGAVAFLEVMADARKEGGEKRRLLEGKLKGSEIRLAELMAAAKERVLAVRGGPKEKVETPAGPAPIARWDFEGDAGDRIGEMHAELKGGAKIEAGALVVGIERGFAATAPLRRSVRAMTLEAWVQLDQFDQRGGGVISMQTTDGHSFNAIVFGEQEPRRWMAGSNVFARTASFNGPDEDAAHGAPVHVAITWSEDGSITGYREGVPYGQSYKKGGTQEFAAGKAQVLLGLRHGEPAEGRILHGRIFEARLYDRALTAEEIARSSMTGANFIAEKDLLAALSAEERAEREELLTRQKDLRSKLATANKPGRPNNEWADFAHALFNLKEFLYLR
jgi:hypothetical protein